MAAKEKMLGKRAAKRDIFKCRRDRPMNIRRESKDKPL